jgi:hypothetical protein
MATVKDIRAGIAKNLANISGLRVTPYVPDSPNAPAAFVEPQTINYDQTFHRGLDEFDFDVTVLVQRVTSERTSQDNLDAYIASSGSKSVKSAIELDRTLGGLVQDCRVVSLSSYGQVSYGDSTYLGAVFSIKVYSN